MEWLVPAPAAKYPEQDITGPTWAETAKRDSNEGHGRGAGGREEEGDGWAGVLRGRGVRGAGGRAKRGT